MLSVLADVSRVARTPSAHFYDLLLGFVIAETPFLEYP